jgi:hypothetical protein
MRRFTSGFNRKSMSKPSRVTNTIRPGNPVRGLNGLTGAPEMEIFGRPVGKFAKRFKKALVGLGKTRR